MASTGANYPVEFAESASVFQPSVGDYCLFHKRGTTLPPWPAMICPDDMAPKHVSDARPLGYDYLIMPVREQSHFCYALSTELRVFEPYQIPQDAIFASELDQAYKLVYRAMDFGDPLKYWKAMTEHQRVDQSSFKRDGNSASEDDSDSDPNIREAKRRSRADVYSRSMTTLLTASASPPSTITRRGDATRRLGPGSPADIRNHFLPANTANAVSNRALSIRQRTQNEDIVEGDLSESKAFVEFLIGPEKVQFLIPLYEVKRRDYFSNVDHGRLQLKGDRAWSLVMPGLEAITPDDFQFAAEYLSTGNFGTRTIDDDNRDTAMAECITAWEAADRLGMEDLLELVVDKSKQTMPWTYEEVSYFSGIVYRMAGSLLDSHETMKDLLADYIANNYYDILESFGDIFTTGMRKIPELERDVFKKLVASAERRMEAEE